MENAINSLRIRHFKSIKDVTLQPRRVNLIIGQPNVGKSNVLEALSLLGAGLYDRGSKFMENVVRYETVSNLFYDSDPTHSVVVETSTARAVLRALEGSAEYHLVSVSSELLGRLTALFRQRFPDVDFRLAENFDRAQSRLAVGDTHTQQIIQQLQGAPYFISRLGTSDTGNYSACVTV